MVNLLLISPKIYTNRSPEMCTYFLSAQDYRCVVTGNTLKKYSRAAGDRSQVKNVDVMVGEAEMNPKRRSGASKVAHVTISFSAHPQFPVHVFRGASAYAILGSQWIICLGPRNTPYERNDQQSSWLWKLKKAICKFRGLRMVHLSGKGLMLHPKR